MAIHPIETRYKTDLAEIFTEEYRLQKFLEVEAALAEAHAQLGNIPKKSAQNIRRKASTKYVKAKRVKEIEKETRHDIMSVVKALAEQCGKDGGYVHLGATSYDIIDTAWGMIFKDALARLEKRLQGLKKILVGLADKHKSLVCIGRTHGQHAIPTTLGYKFALYALEFKRHIDRVEELRPRLLVGKMSGAVGNYASYGEAGDKIEKIVMKKTGLKAVSSNQVTPRDNFAEYIMLLALIAQTLYKIGKEIRNLERTEIRELEEPFAKKQVGSSTMPQKRNPWRCERICGLARVVKSNVTVALDNIPLEHERDLTNSSAERIIIPETSVLLDFILSEAEKILSGLVVYPGRIRENLEMTSMYMGEAIMIKLAEKIGRQKAHELVREVAMKSFEEKEDFKHVVLHSKVADHLSVREIIDLLKPEKYTGLAEQKTAEIVKKLS